MGVTFPGESAEYRAARDRLLQQERTTLSELFAPGKDDHGLDLINPIFNLFDMTPEGRGDFYTKLRYP